MTRGFIGAERKMIQDIKEFRHMSGLRTTGQLKILKHVTVNTDCREFRFHSYDKGDGHSTIGSTHGHLSLSGDLVSAIPMKPSTDSHYTQFMAHGCLCVPQKTGPKRCMICQV